MDIEIIYESEAVSRRSSTQNVRVVKNIATERSVGKRKHDDDESPRNNLVKPSKNKEIDASNGSMKPPKTDAVIQSKVEQHEMHAETAFLLKTDPFADDLYTKSVSHIEDILPAPTSLHATTNGISAAQTNIDTKRDAFAVMMQQSKQFYSYSVESKKFAAEESRWKQVAGSSNVKQDKRPKRYCPFYKKMPFTHSTVDAFKYGTIPNIAAYFLSHFHSDHYGGMTSNFVLKHHVYASKISANLIKLRICANATPETLHVLPPLGQTCVIDGLKVTTFDANHCPGALVILFELPNGKKYVHCGDFRADPSVFSQPQYKQLENLRPDHLYLDTTYLDPKYDFLPQAQVVAFAGRLAKRCLDEDPRTLFVCGSYSIGKERVFMSMSDAIKSKVFCYSLAKLNTLYALEWPELDALLVRDGNKAQVHVVPMGMLQPAILEKYLRTYEQRFARVVAVKPTGWTHRASTNGAESGLDSMKPAKTGRISIYMIPYSEHSSFSELEWFVKFLKPQKIIPTVNLYSADSRRKMNEHLCRWMAEVGTQRAGPLIDAEIVENTQDEARSVCSSVAGSSYMGEFDNDEIGDDDV